MSERMNLIRALKLSGKLLLALAITWGIAYWDATESAFLQIQSSLHMARQIADQAQSLSLYARERQENNPVGWATRFLNSGIQNRPIKILPTLIGTGSIEGERYRVNEKGHSLIYVRRLFEETGEGVQVDIQMEYVGFLGAHSVEINDLLVAALFIFTYFAIHLGFKWRSHSENVAAVVSTGLVSHASVAGQDLIPFKGIRQEYLEKLVGSWVLEARTGLIQIGMNIKSMTQEAKGLVSMSSKSKRHIEQILMQAQQNPISGNRELMNQTVFEMQNALQSYDEVSRATHRMNENISRSTDSVIKMAQLIQNLKDQADLTAKNSE